MPILVIAGWTNVDDVSLAEDVAGLGWLLAYIFIV